MPSCRAFHSVNEVKKLPQNRVHHNNSTCAPGRDIPVSASTQQLATGCVRFVSNTIMRGGDAGCHITPYWLLRTPTICTRSGSKGVNCPQCLVKRVAERRVGVSVQSFLHGYELSGHKEQAVENRAAEE